VFLFLPIVYFLRCYEKGDVGGEGNEGGAIVEEIPVILNAWEKRLNSISHFRGEKKTPLRNRFGKTERKG